jgi:hypothetical protein
MRYFPSNFPSTSLATPVFLAAVLGAALPSCSKVSSSEDAAGGSPEDNGEAIGGGPGEDASGGGGGEGGAPPRDDRRYVLGTISIDADGNRVSYAQVLTELSGDFDTKNAIEAPGNANFLTSGSSFFYGLAEEPTWVKYSTEGGQFEEVGRLSFAHYGITYMDFNNVVVDDETVVSLLTEPYVAVVWNPKTLKIRGEVDISYLEEDGYSLEAYSPVAYQGKVFFPAKWVNWDALRVKQAVHISVLDPQKLEIDWSAQDERCGAASRVVFDERGYGYVMGDGRNQSMQAFAAFHEEKVVPNCLLRIAPGEHEFEEDYFFTIPELTGGLDSMTSLETASVNSGVGFAMMKYEDRIPEGTGRVDFAYWSVPAYKTWRLVFGDEPRAEVVNGANFSVVGFGGNAVDGKLYVSESDDGSKSTVFEIDPETNQAQRKFTAEGYVSAILPLK